MSCCNIKIDVPRMEEALNSESRSMPSGLSKEEMRAFIIEFANEKGAK